MWLGMQTTVSGWRETTNTALGRLAAPGLVEGTTKAVPVIRKPDSGLCSHAHYRRSGKISVEKYLANIAICRKSIIIKPAKFCIGVAAA